MRQSGTQRLSGLLDVITPIPDASVLVYNLAADDWVPEAYSGAGGPFLPLSGGTLTGNLNVTNGSSYIKENINGVFDIYSAVGYNGQPAGVLHHVATGDTTFGIFRDDGFVACGQSYYAGSPYGSFTYLGGWSFGNGEVDLYSTDGAGSTVQLAAFFGTTSASVWYPGLCIASSSGYTGGIADFEVVDNEYYFAGYGSSSLRVGGNSIFMQDNTIYISDDSGDNISFNGNGLYLDSNNGNPIYLNTADGVDNLVQVGPYLMLNGNPGYVALYASREVDVGNGSYSDPSPGNAYDIKCGGPAGGITTGGQQNANQGYYVNNTLFVDGSKNITAASIITTGDATIGGKLTARIKRRVNTVASSATPTINTDTTDLFTITALAANITSFTTNLSGTPNNGDLLEIRILDNGTARTLAWGASFGSTSTVLPATTVISTTLRVLLEWNSAASLWQCVGVT